MPTTPRSTPEPDDVAARASRLQSGYVYHYAFAMVIGVVLFVAWLSVFG